MKKDITKRKMALHCIIAYAIYISWSFLYIMCYEQIGVKDFFTYGVAFSIPYLIFHGVACLAIFNVPFSASLYYIVRSKVIVSLIASLIGGVLFTLVSRESVHYGFIAGLYASFFGFLIWKNNEINKVIYLSKCYGKSSHKFVNTAAGAGKATSLRSSNSDSIATAAAVAAPAAVAIGIEEFIHHYTDGQYGSAFSGSSHSVPTGDGIDDSIIPLFNPSNGLPMVDSIMDVQGNVYGTNSADTFTGIDHHSSFGGDTSSPMFDDHSSGISHDDHSSFDHSSFDHHSSFDDSNRY